MTRVQDMASITARGVDTKVGDDLQSRAYLVWLRARNSNRTVHGPTVGGLTYNGPLKSIVLSLWPELSTSHRKDELGMFLREVYGYLKATNNAICTNQGSSRGTDVVWWISDVWREPTGPVILRFSTPVKATRAESKLTPKEAGEDRVPAPVTVTHTPVTNDDKDTSMPATSTKELSPQEAFRKRQKDQREENAALVEMSISNASEPLTPTEIAYETGIHETTVRKALEDLVEAGRVYVRQESKAERTLRFGGKQTATVARLYSAKNPVPPRTKRVVNGYKAVSRRDGNNIQRRGVNDALMLGATRTGTWEPIGVIGARARVPQGSRTGAMARLVEQGVIIAKQQKTAKSSITVYRKRSGATNGTGKPEAVVPTPPPVTVSAPATSAKARAIAAVEQLISELGDGTKVERLEAELATANARIAELETALAPLQALMQGKTL